jgi:hypothetical protein
MSQLSLHLLMQREFRHAKRYWSQAAFHALRHTHTHTHTSAACPFTLTLDASFSRSPPPLYFWLSKLPPLLSLTIRPIFCRYRGLFFSRFRSSGSVSRM